MGNTPGSQQQGVGGPVATEECIAVGFHTTGIYLFNRLGGYTQADAENWRRAGCVLQCGADSVLCLHSAGVYHVKMPPFMAVAQRGEETWVWSGPMLRFEGDMENPFVFHDLGVFQVNSSNGTSRKVLEEKWRLVKGIVYVPQDQGIPAAGHALVFEDHGIFRLKADAIGDGSTQINTERWSQVKAAVYDPVRKAAIVFHNFGVYRVNPNDGCHEKISNEHWGNTKGAVWSHEQFAMLWHDRGTFLFNMEDASYQKLNGDNWHRMHCVSPVGAQAYCSMHGLQDTKDGPVHS